MRANHSCPKTKPVINIAMSACIICISNLVEINPPDVPVVDEAGSLDLVVDKVVSLNVVAEETVPLDVVADKGVLVDMELSCKCGRGSG